MIGTLARGGGHNGGFVLVSVLWAVVLIVGLCALFVNVIGLHAQSGSAFARSSVAEAAADGAIRAVAYRLAYEAADAGSAPRNGAWRTCRLFDDVEAHVSVQDQDGLVDLNRAPPALVEATLGKLPSKDRLVVLNAILERRGAVASGPGSASSFGLVGSAMAGAFVSPEELRGSLRQAGAEAEPILQLLTVHSVSDGIDPDVAPVDLSAAWAAVGAPAELVRPSRARIYAIIAVVGERSRGRAARKAVVELVRQPDRPFAIREWGTVSAPPEQKSTGNAGKSYC